MGRRVSLVHLVGEFGVCLFDGLVGGVEVGSGSCL